MCRAIYDMLVYTYYPLPAVYQLLSSIYYLTCVDGPMCVLVRSAAPLLERICAGNGRVSRCTSGRSGTGAGVVAILTIVVVIGAAAAAAVAAAAVVVLAAAGSTRRVDIYYMTCGRCPAAHQFVGRWCVACPRLGGSQLYRSFMSCTTL